MENAIDQRGRDRIRDAIRTGLEQVTVSKGMFVDRGSLATLHTANSSLPKTPRSELARYTDENPLSEFIYETLSKELGERFGYDSDQRNTPLSDIDGYRDTNELANRLFDEVESLPWKYDLTVVIPNAAGEFLVLALGDYEFSPAISLVTLDEAFKASHPSSGDGSIAIGLSGLLTGDRGRAWNSGKSAIKVSADGFVGVYGASETLQNAINLIESFLGILVAMGVVEVVKSYQPSKSTAYLHVHRFVDGAWKSEKSYELPESLSDAIASTQSSHFLSTLPKEQSTSYAKHVAARLSKTLSAGKESTRILTAAKWLLNCHTTADLLLAFVQATVVLEILLGDEKPNERIGLAELLRNRCAYLVAATPSEREQIKNTFDQIYEVRSSIVHTGKHKLNSKERQLFTELRNLAARVINKEVELLYSDSNK